jgi:hypothetical protein
MLAQLVAPLGRASAREIALAAVALASLCWSLSP